MGPSRSATRAGISPAFFIVWAGQLISVTGTTLTAFGLQIFVFTDSGSVTRLVLVALAFALPAVVLAPAAGSLVDRLDRRLVMLAADAIAGTATLALLLVFVADALQPWHIYAAVAVGSAANTFQEPAWMASIPLLVSKEHLGRANGLVQLNQGLSIVIAPALAGLLLATTGLGGVLLVDVGTFAIGVASLAVTRFPAYRRLDDETSVRSVRGDAVLAWRYLTERPGLMGLLWLYAGVNFMLSMSNVLIIPLIASFSTESAAGGVLSAAGAGAVVGSILVGVWGGPRRLIRGILGGIFLSGGFIALGGARASVLWIAVFAILLMLVVPIVNAASQVVWQTKVAEGVQGRVFSLRRMIGQSVSPVALLLAGPLADRVFEPVMAPDGALAGSVGTIIGTGPGRGIGLLYVVAGVGTMAIALVGWLLPRVRNLESELPDEVVVDRQPGGDASTEASTSG